MACLPICGRMFIHYHGYVFIFFWIVLTLFYVLRNISREQEDVNAFRTHAKENFSHNNTEGCTSS